MNRIMGKPKVTRVAATGTSSSGSSNNGNTPSSSTTVASSLDDRDAEIARLKAAIQLQMKQMAKINANLSKYF